VYWRATIDGNCERDRVNNEQLAAEGWTVVRVWEHEDPEAVAERIARAVSSSPPTSH
jgi:DNA mismatch endonuclease (patch repair protein)